MRLQTIAILFSIILLSSALTVSLIPAEALKSKGNPLKQFGSSSKIVCGDRLCSEIPGGYEAWMPGTLPSVSTQEATKVSGTHTDVIYLSQDRVDELINALGDHDNFALIDASMQAHGLKNQHFRAVGFNVVEKATGMSEEVVISPYAAIDPAEEIFGSVGIGESDVRGTVIKVDGDTISYTILYVEDGKVVETQFDLGDVPDAASAPSTFEHESSAMIAKEASNLFINDDYTASTYTADEIEQMKSFADAVAGIAVHHASASQ